MAYSSNETGRSEVYIQRLAPGGGKWRISTHGGSMARWRADLGAVLPDAGPEADRGLAEPRVRCASDRRADDAVRHAERAAATLSFGARQQYTAGRDGQRFLCIEAVGSSSPKVVVVLDWAARLKPQ